MEAKVNIWVGVDGGYCGYLDAMLEALEAPWGIPFEDVHIEEFQAGGSIEGYGITVYRHDWNSGADRFDIARIDRKIKEVKGAAERFFSFCNIAREVTVYLQTDYQ